MIEINLIPDVKRELLKAQRMRATVISISIITSIAAAGIVVILLLYILGVQNVRGFVLDNSIKDGNTELQKTEDLSKMLTIQNQLEKVSSLNDQKLMSSRIFDTLSAVIPPDPNGVKVSLIAIDAALGTVRIEGQTAGYGSMEVFKKTLDSTLIEYTDPDPENGGVKTEKLTETISMDESGYGEDASGQRVLRFTLTIKYAKMLFSPKVADITYKLRIDGNVTDSYLGIPKSIFTEKAKDL